MAVEKSNLEINMIEVIHDKEPKWMPAEACAFCRAPTRYWYTAKDVAVCPGCAETHEATDVPSKREWINANLEEGMEPLPEGWKCHADLAGIQ